MVRQDMAFFDRKSPGELSAVISGNMDTFKMAICYKFSDFVSLMARGLALITFAMINAWKFTIVFLPIIPVIVLCTNLMIRVIKKYTIKEFASYGQASTVAQEVLSSLRTVVSFGLQNKFIGIYGDNLHSAEAMGIRKGFLKGIFESITVFLTNIVFGIGIVYAIYLSSTDCQAYNPANIMGSFFSIVTCTFAVGQALPFLSDLAQAKGAAKKVFEIIETKSKIDVFETKTKKIENLKGNISFENVHFHYPTRPEIKILQGLTLNIPAGKTVAFCGERFIF